MPTYSDDGRLYSDYGDFYEGDYVTRDGTDVHFVTNMSLDGHSANFVCVVAPDSGWAKVGEIEPNLCKRYSSVNYTPPNATN
jgi:hypothetical protein